MNPRQTPFPQLETVRQQRPRALRSIGEFARQRSERTAADAPRGPVHRHHGVSPSPEPGQQIDRFQRSGFAAGHPAGLKLDHRAHQRVPVREVMIELRLRGRARLHDILQAGPACTSPVDEAGRRLDNPRARRGAARRGRLRLALLRSLLSGRPRALCHRRIVHGIGLDSPVSGGELRPIWTDRSRKMETENSHASSAKRRRLPETRGPRGRGRNDRAARRACRVVGRGPDLSRRLVPVLQRPARRLRIREGSAGPSRRESRGAIGR